MGGQDAEVRTRPCRWCKRPLKQRRWWRPKRYCNRWHWFRFRVLDAVARAVDNLL